MLTTTVFLDFGAGIGMGSTLNTSVAAFRGIFGGNNTGTNMGQDSMMNPNPFNDDDAMFFSPLSYDFDLNGVINNADLTAMANAVVPLVQRALEPFDINVVVAAAASLADAVTSVGNNAGDASGEFDSYVFVTNVTSDDPALNVPGGLFGRAALRDLGSQTGNNNDEAGLTFANNVFNSTPGTAGTAAFNANLAQRLAYTSTHEAFHMFSYVHTPDESTGASATANQRLLASGDVIRRGSQTRDNPFMVTRFDLQHLGAAVPEPNNYLLAANDPDIGLRDADSSGTPDLAYATGTGAHDEVILNDIGGGVVDVDVNAFSNASRTLAIASESYNIDLATDTDGEILVDAGINNDEVRIDATIVAPMRLRAGTGIDGITTENDLLTLQSGGLTGTYTPGGIGAGSVSYAGGAQIDYVEFENVEADNIPIEVAPLSLVSNSIDEGTAAQLSGSFVNIDTLDEHTVTIDWGDGSTPSEVVLPAGVRDFDVEHVYLDDTPGGTSSDNFMISVTIEDEDGDSGEADTQIEVNNVDPEIAPINLSASEINEAQSVTVSGSFTDPALGVPTETFTGSAIWSDGVVTLLNIDGDAGTFSTTRDFPDDDPDTGTPSDLFTVEITINDDDLGSDVRDSPQLTVHNVDPVVTSFKSDATFDNKGKEGEPVQFDGTFTDVGVLDTHTAIVDWGDGSPAEEVTLVQGAGFGSFAGQHTYDFGGVYTVTVTVTDDDTGSHELSTLAVITGVGLNNGVLYVVGDDVDNHVNVHEVGTDEIRVHADFIPEPHRTFDLGQVDQIIAYLCEGSDHMAIAGNVAVPAIVHGGEGDDHLTGGAGPNVLLGDAGDDMLIGGSGSSILIGGEGIDRLVGGKKDDVLIGGSTDQDSDDGALSSAATAWVDPNDDYEARVLAVDAALAVQDDGVPDTLAGSSDQDLFFGAPGDAILDVKNNESIL